MAGYILKRLIAAIPTLLFVSLLVFTLLRLLPGDVVLARLSQGGAVTPAIEERLREELGLNTPAWQQYLEWLGGVVRGDFGNSLWNPSESVGDRILDRLPLTLETILLSVVLAVILAIPLGVISAVKQDTPIDYGARLFAIFGLSIPDFVFGLAIVLLLSTRVGWLPESGWFPPWEDPVKNIQALMFPALILGYRLSAISARMTRSTMLEVMREDYVRTARAKGLGEQTVIMRHALRNALIPVITIMAGQVAFLFGGTVIIEQIFSLPGMGRATLDAVTQRDYTVVQGMVFMMALVFVTVNLAVDVVYAMLDPRIRYS